MNRQPLIVEKLSVAFAGRLVVRDLSFALAPGRILALVGESGSGKSVTARSLVGLAGDGAKVHADRLALGERDLTHLNEAGWRALRGSAIGFVLQDALVSLDPLRPVGREIEEALTAHGALGGFRHRQARRERVAALMKRVGLPDPASRARQRPDELSGGQRQRALIASAIALDPDLLIADEPTTALDATAAAQILDLFRSIREDGRAVLLISHDLAAVARVADDVIVMRDGVAVEQGPVEQVLGAPRHPYTRMLRDSVPGRTRHRNARADDAPVVLEAFGIGKRYVDPGGRERVALDQVDFAVRRGCTLGILGESGSGKTTAARIATGFVTPDTGRVTFDDMPWNTASEHGRPMIHERSRRALRHRIGVIYQDPLSSFDPRWTVGRILDDALGAILVPRQERLARIASLLQSVRLSADIVGRFPLQLSGGQRQRVAIARALATSPKLIICDEPVSALDVSVQAQVLDLLTDLQARLGVAYLFISHDVGVIRQMSDDVLVMQEGKVVESGTADRVFGDPRTDFTRQLLQAASSF